MGEQSRWTMKLLLLAALLLGVHASEVKDLGTPDVKSMDVGESAKAKAKTGIFNSALMTSGSFTMMTAGGFEEEEEEEDDLGEANGWDLTNGGKCQQGGEAYVLTDAASKTGKCQVRSRQGVQRAVLPQWQGLHAVAT